MPLYRSPSITGEPTPLVDAIKDHIETFVTTLKRGKLGQRDGTSLSTNAACETVALMLNVVKLFAEHVERPDSPSIQMLRAQYPAVVVATTEVQYLLRLIKMTGDAVLRSQFSSLLLTNVTRRVLSIVREAAASKTASEAELERLAAEQLARADAALEELEGYISSDADGEAAVVNEEEPRSISGSGTPTKGAATVGPCGSLAPHVKSSAPSPMSQRGSSVGSPRSPPCAEGEGVGRRVPRGLARDRGGRESLTRAAALGRGWSSNLGLTKADKETAACLLSQAGGSTQTTDLLVAVQMPGHHLLKRAPSLLGEQEEGRVEEFPVRLPAFLESCIDRISALHVDIESMCEELCKRATKQLHASDTVLTIGSSHTTTQYLLSAAADRHHGHGTFKVIIIEGAPFPDSATQKLAKQLRDHDVSVQIMPDSSTFAVMGMCTKVIIGVESVLANGGVLALTGTHPLCIAAKHFAVPVLVVTTTLKMSPYYPSDALCTSLVRIARSGAQELPWSTYGSPNDVLPRPYGEDMERVGAFTVHSPVAEYVPPELITLFATNESEFTPSQIHRVVRENYNPED